MDKKKILIASLFAAIMILVPFTVVATDPIRSVRERDPADDSKLEKESEPDYKVPEFIDITDLDLSREELADLQKKADFASELALATEDYFGITLSVVYVPVLQNGVELMTLPVMEQEDFILLDEGSLIAMPMGGSSSSSDLKCAMLFAGALAYDAIAAVAAYGCAISLDPMLCSVAAVAIAAAATAWQLYKEECSGTTSSSTSSSVQTIIDTITTGATVEIAEIFDVVQMIEGETCGCGA